MWTDLDRDKAIGWQEWKRTCCSDCGTQADWWDPKHGGHRFAFVAETNRCPGCEIIEQTRESVPHREKGIHVFLTPNPDPPQVTQRTKVGATDGR